MLSNKPYAVFTRNGSPDDLTFFSYSKNFNQFSCTHGGWSGYYKLDTDGKPSLYVDEACKNKITSYDDVHFLTEEEYEISYREWRI